MQTEREPLTVVVAEDEFLVSKEVERTARQAGFRLVGVASDGAEALELVKRTSPSVALLDIQMPRLGGLEVARRLREEHPTPVVILTAYESDELLREARDAGVGAYLTKPPDASSLLRAVEIAVARHADLMEVRRLNAELQRALEEVKTLRGILPVCSFCKRIRSDVGAWEPMEQYVSRHSDAQFSHGVCPECESRYYPEYSGD